MRRNFLTFFIGLAFGTTLIVAKVVAQDEPQSIIALFGDSITVGENTSTYYSDCNAPGSAAGRGGRPGFGLGRTNFCNPDRELESLLNDSERPATVVNWGIGGTLTSANANNGLSRIESNLNQTKAAFPGENNYFVLILYGTNDVSFGVTPGTIGFNISLMIDRARSVGWTPVVGNLLPRSALNVSSANGVIQNVANQRNALFVNQFSNFVNKGGFALHDDESVASISERLHPSETGYQVVAQQWFDAALEGLISPLPPEPDPVVAPIFLLLLDEEEE